MIRPISLALALLAAHLVSTSTHAAEEAEKLVTYRALTLELALKAAQASLEACRKADYQVSVAVVDRGGNVQVLLRDRYAGAHTPDSAIGKAWTAVSFRTNTRDLVASTQPGTPQSGARDIPGALMLGGGVTISAHGAIVGGIGVAGAPTGDADDLCAKAGPAALEEELHF
jgi:uncharacterized protein GlcG (DUF336 family)